MERIEQLSLIKPFLVEKISQGAKSVTTSEIFDWLRIQWPDIIREWKGNGEIAAANGIKKAIGDTLGIKFLCWENINGIIKIPENGLEMIEEKTR